MEVNMYRRRWNVAFERIYSAGKRSGVQSGKTKQIVRIDRLYIKYILDVLKRLEKAGFQININKYKLYIIKIEYLGLIITPSSIKMVIDKVKIVLE